VPVDASERLVNLTIALLHAARRGLTRDEVRRTVAGYEADGAHTAAAEEAFRRQFEHDKDRLRGLGIPVETIPADWTGRAEAYRILPDAYRLPPISVTPAQAAVLGLAAAVWRSPENRDRVRLALAKLAGGGVDIAPPRLAALDPVAAPAEECWDGFADALAERTPVTFGYRKRGAADAERRRLEPWRLLFVNDHWYVVGRDRDRDAARWFRLSRVVGVVEPDGPAGSVTVPDPADLADLLAGGPDPWGDAPTQTIVVHVRRGAGHGLRAGALSVLPLGSVTPADPGEGWDVVVRSVRSLDDAAATVCEHGADVIAVAPPELVERVVARLSAVAARVAGRSPADRSPAAGRRVPPSSPGPLTTEVTS
jgi:proteasome accessory factor B